MRRTAVRIGVALVGLCTALAACATNRQPTGGPPAILASTDVWASVARSVAGADATVSSIVNGPVDPHSFEPSPSAVAAIEDASVVVYNGGGYDAWVDSVLKRRPDVPAIDAVAVRDSATGNHGDSNEHVFYDIDTAKAVAGRIADLLTEQDPTHADGYRARATEFGLRADRVAERETALRAEFPGASVIATEPVAHYLLAAAGLDDKTPGGFTNAIEQDTDPSPADMAATLDLITGRKVSALVVNGQTITGATAKVRDAARSAGIPVVDVTETLPAGTDYLGWQSDTVGRLAAALREGR